MLASRSYRFLFTLLIATLVPARLLAQEPPDTFYLSELIVTANRLAVPRTAVPAAVTVIRGDQLRERGIRYVADALREVPGLALARNGSVGGLTSAFLRGGESDYVQVLVDGVQVNDPGGAFDFANLTTADVERIEIVRGPVSVLYGSDAATGVIQIFTRRGGGAPRVEAAVGGARSTRVGAGGAGGYGSWTASAGVTGAIRVADYALTVSRNENDGAYAFNNAYDNTTLGVRLRMTPDARTDAAVTARWSDALFHYPTNGAGALVDRNQSRASESLSLGIEAGRFLTSSIEGRLSFSAVNGNYLIDDRTDDAADTIGGYALRVDDRLRRRAVEALINVHGGDRLSATIGGEAERQSAVSSTLSESSFGPFESSSENERTNRALFAQILFTPAPPVSITAGGRLDDNDRFGTFRTYRVGINVRPARGLVLRATAGTGFKEPTFFENYAEGFVRGNPSLEPERTRSVEIGAEQRLLRNRLTLGVTAYAQRFRNLIQFTFAPPQPDDANYFNIGEAESNGIELSADWVPSGGFTASASLHRLHTEVLDEGFGADRLFIEGAPLVRRPATYAVAAAGWQATRWNVRATLTHVGERDDLDFSDPAEFNGIRVVLPTYTTLNVSAMFSMLPDEERGLDLVLRIDNLLDTRYQEITNFPSLRRSVYAGLRTTLGF